MNNNVSNYSDCPSAPRAPRLARFGMCLLLLGIAVAAIWWIDRGAMLTNTHF
jgi:hypothetical protein